MKFNKFIFVALMLSVLLVFTACVPKVSSDNMDKAEEPMAEEAVSEDEAMEEKSMIVYTFDGKEVNLLDGNRTYVKAWASWCSVCLAGLGEVDELSASETDFRVVTVVSPNEFGEQNEEDFKAWWAGLESEYPNIEVLMDLDNEFFPSFGMRAFPTSVYIGSSGEYENIIIGHNANDLILESMKGVN